MSIQNYMNITAKTTNRQSQNNADIVIVGNGIAGLTAAIEARRLAPALRIAIITEQSHPTINTPALKQFAIGKLERQQLLTYPVGTERDQRIQLIHARVVEINRAGPIRALSQWICVRLWFTSARHRQHSNRPSYTSAWPRF